MDKELLVIFCCELDNEPSPARPTDSALMWLEWCVRLVLILVVGGVSVSLVSLDILFEDMKGSGPLTFSSSSVLVVFPSLICEMFSPFGGSSFSESAFEESSLFDGTFALDSSVLCLCVDFNLVLHWAADSFVSVSEKARAKCLCTWSVVSEMSLSMKLGGLCVRTMGPTTLSNSA
eukprot:scaffold11325_cov56-Attheya_sp.AAC.5